MTTSDQVVHFPYSSIQFITDSNQCQHLTDESIKYLTLESTNVVRTFLQDALKFTRKCRRTKMVAEDFESAAKLRHLDPIMGTRLTQKNLAFKTTTVSNHRDVHYIEDQEVQLGQVIASSLPKLPLEISIRAHWLGIDGKQPSIPENPEIISKSDLIADSLDPMKSLVKKRYDLDSSKIKSADPHELSLEQQIYFKEITEACVGLEDHKRVEAIGSLTNETGLHQILPRLVLFISEGVKINLIQNNLAILIYLMRMVNALLDNKSVHCETFLHQLFPTVMSCILSRQLCSRPDVENHWALRDFAASRCAQMVKMFSDSAHGLHKRIVRIFVQTLQNERLPLVTHYGALVGLCEMGQENIEKLVFPLLRILGDRCANSSSDKITIGKIQTIVMKYIPTAYHASHTTPDSLDYFKHEFGHFFGQRLYDTVIQLYQRTPSHAIQVSIQTHLNGF